MRWLALSGLGNFKRCPVLTHIEFWLFLGRPLKDVRVFPHPKFSTIWADPTFSVVRITFLAEEEAQNVDILPHPKFWPFLAALFKMSSFYPILNFCHFWASLPGHPF